MIKQCTGCPVMFDDAGWQSKLYHSIGCRDATKRRRAVERDRGATVIISPQVRANDSGTTLINNPTTDALDLAATQFLADPTKIPAIVTGAIPEWTAPAGIWFKEQTEKPGQWTFCNERWLD